MTEHDVDVGDATLRVRVRSGELMVVFLHGLAGHRGEWRPVIDRLDAGIGIIAPDLRGHGESWSRIGRSQRLGLISRRRVAGGSGFNRAGSPASFGA